MDGDLNMVLDIMRSWLDGEPVWPYRRIVEAWGPEFEMYSRRWLREAAEAVEIGELKLRVDYENIISRGLSIWQLRDTFVQHYGFAIPCAELLDELAKADHVVEVGAGSGYMTRLMRNRGINVTGSDSAKPGQSGHGFMISCWDEQQVCATATAMVHQYPKATIFCSWPSLRLQWFRFMLQAMQIGQRLVVIREGECAEERAWNYIDNCFEEVDQEREQSVKSSK
jgi:hypothetical protein